LGCTGVTGGVTAVRCSDAPAGNTTGSVVTLERTLHSVLAAASSRCTSCRTASGAEGGAGCDGVAAAVADSVRLTPLARRASSACPGTADANNGALGTSDVAGDFCGGMLVSAGRRPTDARVASNAAALPTGAEVVGCCVPEGAGAEAAVGCVAAGAGTKGGGAGAETAVSCVAARAGIEGGAGTEAVVGGVAEGAVLSAMGDGDAGSAAGVSGAVAEGSEASSVAAEGMATDDGAAPPTDSFSRRSTAARTSCGTPCRPLGA
jgi:hypothetical protein